MQVVVESVSALERRLKITVPVSRIEQSFNNRLNQTARTIKMDGFRAGKVPVSMVKKRFGESIRSEALEDVIRDSYVAAVESQNIRVAGFPSIEPFNAPQGQDFEFTAVVEVYPEITLGEFSAIAVERPTAEVTDGDVNDMIENLRRQRAKFNETSEAAAEQDRVTLDFEGTVNGEAFPGNSAKDFNLVLGSKRMIPGFEEQVAGMKAGEARTITVTFPEDYQADTLAGKEAQFNITVSKVSRPELPELDETFLSAFGVTEGGLDQFRADVRKNMERELRNNIRARVKGAVFDALLTANPLALPKALVAQEIQRQREQAMQRFGGNAQNIKPEMLPNELFEEASRRAVALGLLVSEVIKRHDIKVDGRRVADLVNEIAESYEDPSEVFAWYMGNREQRAQVESAVLEDQVVELVLATAQVTDKAVPYGELLRQQ